MANQNYAKVAPSHRSLMRAPRSLKVPARRLATANQNYAKVAPSRRHLMRAPPSLTTPTLPRYAHIIAATEQTREYALP